MPLVTLKNRCSANLPVMCRGIGCSDASAVCTMSEAFAPSEAAEEAAFGAVFAGRQTRMSIAAMSSTFRVQFGCFFIV